MTKDQLIEAARASGFLIDTYAQKYQPNCILSTYGLIDENLERFAALVAAVEREECAKVCDGLTGRSYEFDLGRLHSAKVIRERSST